MISLQLIENSLWSAASPDRDMNSSDIKTLCQQLDNCNKATSSFVKGEIDEETYLDILENNGHEIDIYLFTVDSNFDLIGI